MPRRVVGQSCALRTEDFGWHTNCDAPVYCSCATAVPSPDVNRHSPLILVGLNVGGATKRRRSFVPPDSSCLDKILTPTFDVKVAHSTVCAGPSPVRPRAGSNGRGGRQYTRSYYVDSASLTFRLLHRFDVEASEDCRRGSCGILSV